MGRPLSDGVVSVLFTDYSMNSFFQVSCFEGQQSFTALMHTNYLVLSVVHGILNTTATCLTKCVLESTDCPCCSSRSFRFRTSLIDHTNTIESRNIGNILFRHQQEGGGGREVYRERRTDVFAAR